MNNKGFTKVPNAIIRSSVLSIAEKAVWCYIASMPDRYRYSVRSACMVLHIGDKKWRRAIIKLEKLGLISVRHMPGMTTVYEASKNALGWNLTPGQMTNGSNDTSSQITCGSNDSSGQLTAPPRVNGQQVTHINNKEQLNNNVDDDTCAHIREEFEHEVMIDGKIELACMSYGITKAQYKELAAAIIAEWKFKDLPDIEWTKNHFISVLRYKVNSNKSFNYGKDNKRNNATSNPLANATIHTAHIG